MQSNSSLFTTPARRILPTPFNSTVPDDDPASSDPIGGSADVAMCAIETSLKVLKEASTLASKVPFIGPIAGIILEALKMRGEVKQLKGEWGAVMQKLAKVGSIVVDVGEWYQANDMSEDDLPSDLRNVLKSLQTDLDGIQDVLEECAKVKGFRRVLLRSDILAKVKQYDAKLTHAFQVFHARVTLGSRLAQIVQENRLNSLGETAVSNARARERMPHIPPDIYAGSAYLTEPLATMPSAPQTFFGRVAELAQIIEMIFANTSSRPARIAILGPGGYGKTTLAHAVLDHPRVREHYGDARYMVTCESLMSSAALLIQLAKTLGVSKENSDFLWSRIRRSLIVEDCVICFDNFESPWDQPGDIKASVEDLLSKITELHHVTVIITMRGTERPARTQWTQPTLAPLKTLDSDAVGVPVDPIMVEIKTSLGILKEASSLASKVPCIAQIAGMLLYAIQLHGEVRHFKEEWEVVANKLADVANIVINVGRSYEMHELGEEDLVDLQIDLQYLQRGLEGVEGFLEECAEYPGVEKVLQLGYIQTKVKQCDNMLSHALDDFQVRLELRHPPRGASDQIPGGSYTRGALRIHSTLPTQDPEVNTTSGHKPPDLIPSSDFPAVSDAVGGPVDTIMSAVKTSLGLLKEASSLASKVPYIGAISGMLLYTIQVNSGDRQFKEEWAIVAQRLLEVANIVISVGKSCETHGLGEEDLAHLENALQPLQKSLEAIGRMLKECAEYAVIKKVLQRSDIQTKVKQCDAMLSHALNVFQAKLTLHIHFTQLIQVNPVVGYKSSYVIPSGDSSATLDAVGGPVDSIVSGTSLSVVREANSLASKVRGISSTAGMLLYAIQSHDEVRQFKEEWAIVAQRLLEVANIVISVGKSCEMHGLDEEDLAHLETIFQPLQESLEAIGRLFEECAEYGVIKKVLQRADIQTKVKQCDSMLSHAFNVFQVKVTLQIHIAQLIQGRAANTATVSPPAGFASSSRAIT